MSAETFFKKNLKIITIVIFGLFMIKTFQSCNRDLKITKLEKEIVYTTDSLAIVRGDLEKTFKVEIDSLKGVILERDFLIKDLDNELKIAGVRASEAQRRADAVQQTAEKVKNNNTTTILIEKEDRDTSRFNQNN